MRALMPLLLALTAAASPALAADLIVTIRTADGQPVKDAVATLHYPGGAENTVGAKLAGPYVVSQHGISFDPFVVVVPVGADVTFPNKDTVRHHVYSFSPAKRFELKLYGREDARAVKFEKVGVVALGCNIHDKMLGFVDVVDTPFVAKTDDKGEAILSDLPAGAGTLVLWQPYLKSPRNEQTHGVVIDNNTHQSYVVDLRAPPATMTMSMGQ